MTIRYDSAPIKARFDESGYLRDEPVVARTGVLTYFEKDGKKRIELRRASEVFREDSLESYSGQAITIGHGAMVNAKNFKKHGVGTALGVGRQDGENVRVPIIIQDERAVSAARDQKLNSLSVGYNVNYIPRPGMWNSLTDEIIYNDERNDKQGDQEFIGKEWVYFDGEQTDIKVNHIALVRKGRAGAIARLNLDGDEEFDYTDSENKSTKGDKMKTIRLDSGVEVEVDEHVATHIETLASKVDAEKARADSLGEQNTTLQAKADTLQATVDGIPAQIEQARNDAAQAVKARNGLEATAAKFGVKDFASMSDMDIKRAVIGKTSKINLDGRDDSYIDVAYDMAAESVPAISRQREQVNGGSARNDSANESGSSAQDARAKMQARILKKEAK